MNLSRYSCFAGSVFLKAACRSRKSCSVREMCQDSCARECVTWTWYSVVLSPSIRLCLDDTTVTSSMPLTSNQPEPDLVRGCLPPRVCTPHDGCGFAGRVCPVLPPTLSLSIFTHSFKSPLATVDSSTRSPFSSIIVKQKCRSVLETEVSTVAPASSNSSEGGLCRAASSGASYTLRVVRLRTTHFCLHLRRNPVSRFSKSPRLMPRRAARILIVSTVKLMCAFHSSQSSSHSAQSASCRAHPQTSKQNFFLYLSPAFSTVHASSMTIEPFATLSSGAAKYESVALLRRKYRCCQAENGIWPCAHTVACAELGLRDRWGRGAHAFRQMAHQNGQLAVGLGRAGSPSRGALC